MEKYDPIRVLGEGSFGKVYLMRDKVRRKFVCVKIIKIKNIPKKEREATKVEVELLKRLNHPNIVRYIDSFLSKNSESLCIVMEYCDGGDLASQIKAARRKLFSEDKILHWFVQIALGVHYMHTRNVLHRDLKTQNIFLLGNGRLVLGDLGISKVLEGTMDMAQTCIGTPYYMSPEIFKNKPYSYKSDVWALGCVLYEMTTLNHAFDANSLNGLAQKIIKGRYPAIHHKYSRYLRELIGHMLLPEPKQRPDLDQILRKPFIKKHILQFFQDIHSRPSEGIGEGTMIVRAAVGGPVGTVGNDANMLSFREQLESLDMAQALNEAQAPIARVAPQSEDEAKKLAKDASNALKREKDHRKMVESALEKLRQERESRAKERLAMQQQQGAVGRRVIPRAAAAPTGLKRDAAPSKPAAMRQPRQSGLRYDGREAPPAAGAQGAHSSRSRVEVSPSGHGHAHAQRDRGKRHSEARDRQIAEDRERRAREAQQAQDLIEEHRKLKEKEELAVAQKRREDMARAAREQARQQQEMAARRDAQRERERLRQAEEIEQLKRDKLELDKRARDREALRDQRRRDERSRLEGARLDNMQDKLGEMNDQVSRLAVNAAEDKLSARERVQQRKMEKQAKEDAERMEALRLAEEQNRRVRQNAYNQQRSQFHGHNDEADAKGSFPSDEAQGKGGGLGMEELTAKLHVARGAPRYERGITSDDVGGDDQDDSDSGGDDELWGDEDPDDAQEEEEIMHKREEELQAELSLATKRCQELKETLQVTKSFIDGRGKGAGGGNRTKVVDDVINSDDDEDDDLDEVLEYDEEDDAGNNWDEQSAKSVASVVPPPPARRQESVTPRMNRPDPIAVIKQPSYKNLADAPSPSGRLGDRIVRLKQRCILALGSRAFNEAYSYLKDNAGDDNDDDIYDDDDGDTPKQRRIREILGPDKAHYMPLIDQLVFMEESHGG